MPAEYHAGEVTVQERAGVRERALRIARAGHDVVPPVAAAFLEQRRFVVVATVDRDGRPWASMLAGAPGFTRATDERIVRIDAAPAPGDPVAGHVGVSPFAGLLAIDLATRRRMRVNGRLARADDGAMLIHVEQVYSNCPKYIQRRAGEEEPVGRAARLVSRARALTAEQREWIGRADTFFIATAHPGEGADASHRGGMPGFMAVDGNRLVWPDYVGNAMFNTLGNVTVHPWAGLVIPDFETGATLQLTGRATIDWDPAHAAPIPGAERLVELAVEEVVELADAIPLSLRLLDYSKFNPPAP